jgi:hypothetical protein
VILSKKQNRINKKGPFGPFSFMAGEQGLLGTSLYLAPIGASVADAPLFKIAPGDFVEPRGSHPLYLQNK